MSDKSSQSRPALARPYARTGGRTRPDHHLELEAVVTTSELGRKGAGSGTAEQRRICEFCEQARTIADVVAELRLPVGTVKVIVADMASEGLVLVHQPGLAFGDKASREFTERLLASLREV